MRRGGDGVRRAVTAAAAVTLTAFAHAAPSVTAIGWLRLRCCPGLSGRGDAGTVAVTFDDGPHPESTPAFLDTLARLGVPATFFVLGELAVHAPDLLRRARDEGHELAVHGWTHRSHLRLAPGRVYAEMAHTADVIERVAGTRPAWFRPPYGILSAGSLLAARRLGLRPVLWTASGHDWRATATTRSIVDTMGRGGGLEPGGTLLLHDSDYTSAPRSWVNTLAALPEIVAECRRRDARLVTLGAHAGAPLPHSGQCGAADR
jgi:peptidoglycan-N-acetylglucosamine deacetylase